jgi:single-stranded-DNA-specific exonuclease
MLAPRINAAGRLGSAMIAYDLLMADEPEAGVLAQRLQELNGQRQILTLEAVEIARARAMGEADVEVPLIFDAGPEYQSGIVGLVAGRLCEEFYRPAVVVELGDDESRGSCRSIPGFDITQALDECADLLVRHGGHAQAAGFTVRNDNIPSLRERLTVLAAAALDGQELRPELVIDAEVPLDLLTMDLVRALQRLEPTGAGSRMPLFVTRGLRVAEWRRVGRDSQHLRLRLTDDSRSIDAIAFRQADWADPMPARVDVAFHLGINEWNGTTKLQLNVQDLRRSGDDFAD